eukprot:12368310-Ditylum_brightwellii.AAC.1
MDACQGMILWMWLGRLAMLWSSHCQSADPTRDGQDNAAEMPKEFMEVVAEGEDVTDDVNNPAKDFLWVPLALFGWKTRSMQQSKWHWRQTQTALGPWAREPGGSRVHAAVSCGDWRESPWWHHLIAAVGYQQCAQGGDQCVDLCVGGWEGYEQWWVKGGHQCWCPRVVFNISDCLSG